MKGTHCRGAFCGRYGGASVTSSSCGHSRCGTPSVSSTKSSTARSARTHRRFSAWRSARNTDFANTELTASLFEASGGYSLRLRPPSPVRYSLSRVTLSTAHSRNPEPPPARATVSRYRARSPPREGTIICRAAMPGSSSSSPRTNAVSWDTSNTSNAPLVRLTTAAS